MITAIVVLLIFLLLPVIGLTVFGVVGCAWLMFWALVINPWKKLIEYFCDRYQFYRSIKPKPRGKN